MYYLKWIKLEKPIKLNQIIQYPNKHTVLMISLTDDSIKSFESIEMASKFIIKEKFINTKISTVSSSISHVCLGDRKTAYGYKWMYKDDYNKMVDSEKPIQ
jgi:hypothetical protein